jgi:hypothetical protein
MISKSIEALIHLITLGFITISGFIYLCYRYYRKKIKKNFKKK